MLLKKKLYVIACRVVCCSHQSERYIRVFISHQSDCSMYLSPIGLPHQGMYLAPIISQHLDIMFSCKLQYFFLLPLSCYKWNILLSHCLISFLWVCVCPQLIQIMPSGSHTSHCGYQIYLLQATECHSGPY